MDYELTDKQELTPLMQARNGGHRETMKILVMAMLKAYFGQMTVEQREASRQGVSSELRDLVDVAELKALSCKGCSGARG